MQALDNLLKQLGQRLGIPDLAADSSGYCALRVESWTLHLMNVPDRGTVQFMAELGAVPARNPQPVLVDMLAANALFLGTGGATLGLDPARNAAVLSRELPLDNLDFMTFHGALESFIQHAEIWMARLERPSDPVEAAGAPAPMAAMPIDWLRG
jgi:hypothetical protein